MTTNSTENNTNNSLINIFGKNKNIIIGALHFPPLLGYKDFPGMDVALKFALQDLKAFEEGGVDAIIIENNYDVPHKAEVDVSVIAAMTYLGTKIIEQTRLPVGISVLWNDYKTALSIAKVLGLKFIRIPVFVDKVKTDYGIMKPKAKEAVEYRKEIGAEDVLLFTDIHVKHVKEILSKHSITTSAKKAIKAGSDALIITGKWTGDAPDLNDINSVRGVIDSFPILLGSGVDETNKKNLFKNVNGAIVSTSLKCGINDPNEINRRKYNDRVDLKKVRKFVG